jgi:glycosyltransferase involved in cell wall biosynthesis
MTTPGLVSVVIPCYNQAHFLGDSVESVLAQTYPRFEITVVNDGSQDNTAEVAARYHEVHCVSQENRGLCAARNAGLRRSVGEYVVFLDADDRLLPHALETGVGQLVARPGCAFVAGRHRYIDAAGAPLPSLMEQRLVEKDHYLELLRSNYVGCPTSRTTSRAITTYTSASPGSSRSTATVRSSPSTACTARTCRAIWG